MRVTKTRVARHPAVAALLPCLLLLIALIALLTSASCVGQSRAGLLAADIANLGFIPGKPVNMPSGFKAQGGAVRGISQTAYAFENGYYAVDEQGRLMNIMLNYPGKPKEDKVPSDYSEKQKEQWAKMDEFAKNLREAATVVGPSIPEGQRSTLKFTTWNGKDFFTLTEKDIQATYGPPSEPTSPYEPNPGGDSMFEIGMPKIMSYRFQTGADSYASVNFFFKGKGTDEDTVDFISLTWRSDLPDSAMKGEKYYSWPGLYPAPGK